MLLAVVLTPEMGLRRAVHQFAICAIVKNEAPYLLVNGHSFNLVGGITVNAAGKGYSPNFMSLARWLPRSMLEHIHALSSALQKPGKAVRAEHSALRLHHYFTKSQAEWQAKLARGDVNLGSYLPRTESLFAHYDKREVEDRSAITRCNTP